MEHVEDAIKQKRWNDMKASVAAYFSQNNAPEKKLTLDELLLNTKGASKESWSAKACKGIFG